MLRTRKPPAQGELQARVLPSGPRVLAVLRLGVGGPAHLSPRVMVSLLMAEVRLISLPLSTHRCT